MIKTQEGKRLEEEERQNVAYVLHEFVKHTVEARENLGRILISVILHVLCYNLQGIYNNPLLYSSLAFTRGSYIFK